MSACKKTNDLSPTLLGDGIYFSSLNDEGMFCNVTDGKVKLLNSSIPIKNLKVIDESSFKVELTSTTSSSKVLFTKTVITKDDYESAVLNSNKELSGLFYVHTKDRIPSQDANLIMAVKTNSDLSTITVKITKDNNSAYVYKTSGNLYNDCYLMSYFLVNESITNNGQQYFTFGHECNSGQMPTILYFGQRFLVDVVDNGNSN